MDSQTVDRLKQIFSYEGQNVVSKPDFLRVMRNWSAFSANDINNDNILDAREIAMLIWLVNKAKPSRALIEREVKVMDRDHSGTIDRTEWVAYLSAPTNSVYHLGNMEYYDFEMRDLFEKIDQNNDGYIDFDEICYYI